MDWSSKPKAFLICNIIRQHFTLQALDTVELRLTGAKREIVFSLCAVQANNDHGLYWISHQDIHFFFFILRGQCHYFPLTLFDNRVLVSVKEDLTLPHWGPAEIWPPHPLSSSPSPEPWLLDLNHLACYIVRSGVNNALLLKGLTGLKFIN